MARKYPTDKAYEVSTVRGVLETERAFRQDVDMRLDVLERGIATLGGDAGVLVARVIRVIETEIAPRAAEIEALLAGYRDGVPAAAVTESAERFFLTPARRSDILAELRGGVDAAYDTLAELHAAIDTKASPEAVSTAIASAIAALKGSAGAALDTLGELSDALGDDANFAATVTSALGNRLRLDADQGLDAIRRAQGRANLGLGQASTSDAGLVALATAVETLAGTESAKVVTPAGLAGSKSIATSGYYQLPGGLIIQWGTASPSSGVSTVTFPVTFPTALLALTATIVGGATAAESNTVHASAQSASGATLQHRYFIMPPTSIGGNANQDCQWIAIGW